METGLETAAGPGDSQARQFDLSFGLVTQHTEHVQESVGGLNFSPNPEVTRIGGCSVIGLKTGRVS